VAHVELSLSGAFVPQARTPSEAEFVSAGSASNVERWAITVATATEPCLVIDGAATIVAISPSASDLLKLGKPVDAVGQSLLGGVRLIDFTAGGGELDEPEAEKIPPIMAIKSGRLARGLMRVQTDPGDPHITVDAVSTPLMDADQVVASLTFFSAIQY
jgi:hypothetical protein